MSPEQLNRLRLLESELLHQRNRLQAELTKAYELHQLVCEILNSALAGPLTR